MTAVKIEDAEWSPVMERHVLNVFPQMPDAEIERLAKSIKANGQREPVVLWEGRVLDGWNRYLACQRADIEPEFVDAEWPGTAEGSALAYEFGLDLNDIRRHLSASERAMLAERYARSMPGDVGKVAKQTAAAEKFAVSPRFVRMAAALVEDDPVMAERVERGEIKLDVARQRVEAAAKHAVEKTVRAAAAHKLPEWSVHDCACGDMWKNIKPGTVDVIVTDPPYPQEFISTWSELSAFAAYALKPGGLVFAMSGQVALPEVHDRMRERLDYHHEIAMLLPGRTPGIRDRCVNVLWKPVVVYSAPSGVPRQVGSDVFKSDLDGVGLLHKWGQSPVAAAWLIDKCTKPDDLVCDPFVGSAVFAVSALQAGRRFVGCDNGAQDDADLPRFGDRWADIARDEITGV